MPNARRMKLVVLSLLLLPALFAAEPTLLGIQVVTRHGDRTALLQMPKDPVAWGILGELTPEGMAQHFQLGQELRRRYHDVIHLINDSYTPKEIYIRSSGFDRTLISAYSQLQGLFPEGTGPVMQFDGVSPALPHRIQPVPIKTIDKDKEYLLRSHDLCPKATKYREAHVYSSAAYKKMEADNKDLFDLLTEKTGTKTYAQQMIWVADSLLCSHVHNYTLPEGITEAVYQRAMDVFHQVSAFEFPTGAEFAKISCGNLLRELFEVNIPGDLANRTSRMRYRLYSGHDTTLLSLRSAFGYPMTGNPNYADHVILELWDSDDTHPEPFVRSFYTFAPFKIEGCPSLDCPVPTLRDALRPSYAGADWAVKVCGLPDPTCPAETNPPGFSLGYMLAAVVFLATTILGCLFGIVACAKYRALLRKHNEINHMSQGLLTE